MSRTLLLLGPLLCFALASGAQFLVMPQGNVVNRVDLGRISVSGQAITVEALVTVEQAEIDANIISKHSNPQDVNYVLRSHGFFVKTRGRGRGVVRNPVVLCVNKVYHLAGTYDGQYMRYFVNGQEVASAPQTGNLNLNNNVTAIGNMWAGRGVGEQYRGYISEVRIWKVARTEAEIAANMLDLPNPTQQQGLLAYYKFNGSLINLQGNPAFNGKATNARLALGGKNPYFDGSLSYTFCGGDVSLVPPPKIAPPPPPVMAAVTRPPAPAPIFREPVKQPVAVKPVAPPKQLPVAAKPVPPVVKAKPPAPAKPRPPLSDSIYTTIQVWDFDGLDGDSISLKINGKLLGPTAIRLAAFPKYDSPGNTFRAILPPGDNNVLEVTALNQGSVQLATIGLLITDNRKGQRYYFRMKTGQTAAVHFVRQ